MKKQIGGMIFLGSIFGALGFFLLVLGLDDIGKAHASTSWPKTDCTVLKREGSTSSHAAGSHVVSQTYDGSVTYKYTVDGIAYTGQNIRFSAIGTSDAKYVRKILQKYDVGKSVPLAYNPLDPGESVLEPGVFARNYMLIGGGIIFMLVPVFFFTNPFKKKNQERERGLQALSDSFEPGKQYLFHHEENGELIPCTFQKEADGSVSLRGPKFERVYEADPAACREALRFLEINGYFLERS